MNFMPFEMFTKVPANNKFAHLQGSRMPLPEKKSEFLNTGALRKLLPARNIGSTRAPVLKPPAEDDKVGIYLEQTNM